MDALLQGYVFPACIFCYSSYWVVLVMTMAALLMAVCSTRCNVVQVLIRWAIQNGTSVIPKATGVSHIQGNLEALNFELSKEEFEVSCPST